MSDKERPSTVRLTEALKEIPGMPPVMILRAMDGYYSEFGSHLAFPLLQLYEDILALAGEPTTGPKATMMLQSLSRRVTHGDFDDSKEQADAWVRSGEGRETFRELLHGRKMKR